jgi:regulator of sigma E protease
VLLAVVLMQGTDVPSYQDEPVVVGKIEAKSAAEIAGIRPGDRIISVSGTSVKTWEQFFNAMIAHRSETLVVELVRGNETVVKNVTPRPPAGSSPLEIGEVGILPDTHPRIASIIPGEAAERAGFKTGDIVVSVNDEPITFQTHLKAAISKRPEQEIRVASLRNGAPMTILATPALRNNEGMLGITMSDDMISIKPGLVGAVTMSVEKNVEISGMIFQTVWGLLTFQTSPKQLMGPVAIAQLSGESAQQGWIALFLLMAQISLNLGLLNLLPIPILDGGHIFIMSLEGLARRDFSIRLKEKMLFGGFVVLMLLMVTVIYNDLTRISWIERLMPWR